MLRIVSYNVFFLWRASNPMLRADAIAEAIGPENDVLVFLEAFSDSARTRLLKNLHDLGYHHATPVLNERPTEALPPESLREGFQYLRYPMFNGGVVIVSKWPITNRGERVFGHRLGVERFSSKGMVYCEIDWKGQPIHLFAAHAQADDGTLPVETYLPGRVALRMGTPRLSRLAQCRQLTGWMNELSIPYGQPVFIAGDFNVDFHGPEFEPMLEALDATLPDGDHELTLNLPENDFSRVPRRPGFLDWLGGAPVQASTKSEFVDYVLYSNRHRHPTTAHLETVKYRTPPNAAGEAYDLSDHYAVRGTFSFEE